MIWVSAAIVLMHSSQAAYLVWCISALIPASAAWCDDDIVEWAL